MQYLLKRVNLPGQYCTSDLVHDGGPVAVHEEHGRGWLLHEAKRKSRWRLRYSGDYITVGTRKPTIQNPDILKIGFQMVFLFENQTEWSGFQMVIAQWSLVLNKPVNPEPYY